MKRLWLALGCVFLFGCDGDRAAKPTIVDGVSVTINRPEVSIQNGHLFVGSTDHGAVQKGDKVVVDFCNVTVNGQSRIAPP